MLLLGFALSTRGEVIVAPHWSGQQFYSYASLLSKSLSATCVLAEKLARCLRVRQGLAIRSIIQEEAVHSSYGNVVLAGYHMHNALDGRVGSKQHG